jgi:hypothetical protein
MGFNNSFINLIYTCISTSSLSVWWINSLFSSSKGFKVGLSPLPTFLS